VNDVWSDLSRGRAKLYIVLSVLFPNEKKQTDKKQNKKSKSKLVGHYYYYLVSRIRFVVWIVCCSRHSWSLCTHVCVLYTVARVESIQHFSLPISAW
jgi:hypothetical protein